MTQKETRAAVAVIRARGGDVIFLRPPSRGPVRTNEERIAPLDRVWRPLLAAASVRGLHFEDDPVGRGGSSCQSSRIYRARAPWSTRIHMYGVSLN